MKYIIVSKVDALNNYRMLNKSTSSSFDQVRKNSDGSKYLFKVDSDQPDDIFLEYQWYSLSEILVVLEDSEWQ